MRVYLEFLYHFKCEHCTSWWSVADIEPKIGSDWLCPHCGAKNKVEVIQAHVDPAIYEVINSSVGVGQHSDKT